MPSTKAWLSTLDLQGGRSDVAKLTACRKSARFLSAPQREVKATCRAFATRETFDRRCCIGASKHGVAGTRLQAEFRPSGRNFDETPSEGLAGAMRELTKS
jgi:hypothetical protein